LDDGNLIDNGQLAGTATEKKVKNEYMPFVNCNTLPANMLRSNDRKGVWSFFKDFRGLETCACQIVIPDIYRLLRFLDSPH
jgi:hypothetical protein